MEEQQVIKINSGLPDFLLLDAITSVEEKTIAGAREFSQDLPWLGIEALAQLGAFHVRQLTDFQKHAFLLKINRFSLPQSETLQGSYLLQGALVSRSRAAFVYELQAIPCHSRSLQSGIYPPLSLPKSEIGNLSSPVRKFLEFSGNFLYAAVDYDDTFAESRLRNHYLRIFRCLQNVTGNGSGAGKRAGSSAPLL